MKESLALALLLLLALILIPLLAMGGDIELLNPFKTASAPEDDQVGTSSAPADPAMIDPNADAQQKLAELLGGQSSAPGSSDTESTAPPTSAQVVDEFKILNLTTGEVETVSRRDYIIGAVTAEMPASFSVEALKAQAVAAHTYALRRRLNQQVEQDETLKGADFSADPSKLLGYMTEESARERFGETFDVYWGKITEACDEVLEKVLVYDSQPIVAAYHSMSAGKTEDATTVWKDGAPYLVPVESFGDTLAKNYEVETELAADEVQRLLTEKYVDIKLPTDKTKWFAVKDHTESGTVTELTAGDVTMTGQDARALFTLRSANFTVSYANKAFTFTTLGYGHGVGMSQYGADYMARQGSTYEEILAHYYPGTALMDEGELAAAE